MKETIQSIMRQGFTILSLFLMLTNGFSQYSPAAGKAGSTAISKDSSILVNWAKRCTIQRGWQNIAKKDSGFTTIGDSLSAIGAAGENGVVSLGDSGIAICEFNRPIVNGPGFDFAIFENSFDDRYLELAFVEISSDGWRYFRFPCHSLSDTSKQIGAFGYTEPENINNLAGKYRSGYGTPFDIGDIPEYKDLNKNAITHIKITDVVGSLNPRFASYDTANRKINDPWPTPFPSSGFDLDAIGVIHEQPLAGINKIISNQFIKGPNPIRQNETLHIQTENSEFSQLDILNCQGALVQHVYLENTGLTLLYDTLPAGLFFIHLQGNISSIVYRGLKL